MPILGDIRINEITHPPGTPLDEIYDFEIWDGSNWLPACTANDLIYKVGSGATGGLNELIPSRDRES